MIRRNRDCVLGSDRAGNETRKYDGEDGRMDEEFHKPGYLRGQLFMFKVEERD
jgi:hypothetical protein